MSKCDNTEKVAHYAIAECVTDVKFIKKNCKWVKMVNLRSVMKCKKWTDQNDFALHEFS